jgi:hypothetical protein
VFGVTQQRVSLTSPLTTGFWRTLPLRALLKLLVAVYFTFSTIGLVGALTSQPSVHVSITLLAANWLFTGLTSAAWVAAFMTNKRALVAIVPVQVAGFWLLARVGHSPSELGGERADLGVGWVVAACVACLLVGYSFFIDFIVKEGVSHLRLRTEVALAEQTHRRLVPPIRLESDGIEAIGRSDASSEVGGDLVDAVVLADGRFLLYIADVSGHGIAAGTLMSLTKGAIRARLLAGASPRDLLVDVNRLLRELGGPSTFVTLAGACLAGAGQAEVFLAGHLPILHRVASTGAVQRWSNEHLPLGILDGSDYDTRRIAVARGDVLALVTDGLTEVADADDRELGIDGMVEVLAEHGALPLPELQARFLDVVRRHGPQLDDQTLLLIRVR